ncbi:MAG TPA: hypothetical protein PJ997_01410 [Candidatus Paceibacterota bacterium]|nr:hypothetical protein [Candidatus Paceibacterota bacterium]HMP18976.1 hypothetical protein [Candidatus Paceibacterota bacterium]HMP85406.1 hypothetical protein [Candidatus Paceibacterota bacterium]
MKLHRKDENIEDDCMKQQVSRIRDGGGHVPSIFYPGESFVDQIHLPGVVISVGDESSSQQE